MQLKTERDLTFGTVLQGTTSVSIDPVTGGSRAAYFSFIASPNTLVTVSFGVTPLSDGAEMIDFLGALAGNNSVDQQNAVTITTGSSVTTSPRGTYYFWAGGKANLSPNQPIGTYSGSFTLTVAY